MTLKVLTNIGTNNSNATWGTVPAQQVTILDQTNAAAVRSVILRTEGVMVSRGNYAIGVNMATLISAAVAVEPNLTWPPIITIQPASHNIASPNPTNFSVDATSEIAINYQWQSFSSIWSNLANAGVYSAVTTNNVAISNSGGLTGTQYRCLVINAKGTTTSNAATLTVT